VTVELPKSLGANPRLSSWISFDPAGQVTLRVGKAELGQGILTALVQIAAAELSLPPSDIEILGPDTRRGPNEGMTSGSMSVAESGSAVRLACAEARSYFTAAASAKTGVPVGELTLSHGAFRDSQGTLVATYADLVDEVDLHVDAGLIEVLDNRAEAPEWGAHGLARVDLPDKIFGRPRFIHDLEFPGMAHARVIRPPARVSKLLSAPVDSVLQMPGVIDCIRDGEFLAVVAGSQADVRRAADTLASSCTWKTEMSLPSSDDISAWLRVQDASVTQLAHATSTQDAPEATIRSTYSRPFIAHASIAPSCGIALFHDGVLRVWSHSQGVFALRASIAQVVDLPLESVSVEHVEGAGCYGHNAADDAAGDAALIAVRIPGRPVRVEWTREDELSWGPVGAAMTADIAASLDVDGGVATWKYELWSNGHTSRPGYEGTPGLLGASHRAGESPPPPARDPAPERGYGGARNAEPAYEFPSTDIRAHRVLAMPIRTSALRSLGAHLNVFAIESFMDELADHAGRDELEFRLAHLRDPRAREVLELAAATSGWGEPLEANTGRGIAYARYKNRGAYCAVVAEVEAETDIRVRRLVIAVDVGRIVSEDGVRNQIEGGAIQATSWTIREQLQFDHSSVTSRDWLTYPILRFSEVPRVEVRLINRPEAPSLGSGEATQGPVAGAIGNALFDALGVRVRALPLTAEQVAAAIEASD
jgi:nicotinate dehydrogenase subunit B